jgi:hypothetical protein
MIRITEIESLFSGTPPKRGELAHALRDLGRNCLDSDSAIIRFGDRTREEVLQRIRSNLKNGIATHEGLEEWGLLEPNALRYFTHAYLTYLAESLTSECPDPEFMSFFFYNLSEAIRINGPNAFTQPQYEFLLEAAVHSRAVARASPLFEDWIETTSENIDRFLKILGRS